MRAARGAAAAAIIVAAAMSIHAYVLAPYRCNRTLKNAKRSTALAIRESSVPAARLAQRNLEVLEPCAAWCRNSVDALMVLAANDRLLARYDIALEAYDRALRIDRRPELLLNRAMALYEAGDRTSGIDELVTAVNFNSQVFYSIPDPTLREEVRLRVDPKWTPEVK